MRLDSEEQRKLLLDLLLEVPVQTNIRGLLEGLRDDIQALLIAIKTAKLEEQDDG